MKTFSVIIPAAGSGSRIGGDIPKQYREIAGAPALAHVLRVFHSFEECREIIVPIDYDWSQEAGQCAEGIYNVRFVRGGRERQNSIAAALDNMHIRPDIILVHDAARPCISPALIKTVLEGAQKYGAVLPALPITETLKRVSSEGKVLETVPREGLYAAQTPQGARTDILRGAYENATTKGIIGTDDVSLIEAFGRDVQVVKGDPENIKITYPEDFIRAERILRRRQQRANAM